MLEDNKVFNGGKYVFERNTNHLTNIINAMKIISSYGGEQRQFSTVSIVTDGAKTDISNQDQLCRYHGGGQQSELYFGFGRC